tara:strand:+ start:233 stop:412 length:180 start_codon:yes stop_codon:yes gene_type:complete
MDSIVIEMEGGVLRGVSTFREFVVNSNLVLSHKEWRDKHIWEQHKNFNIYLVDYDEEEE